MLANSVSNSNTEDPEGELRFACLYISTHDSILGAKL